MADKVVKPVKSAAHDADREALEARGELNAEENESDARLRDIVENAVDGIMPRMT